MIKVKGRHVHPLLVELWQRLDDEAKLYEVMGATEPRSVTAVREILSACLALDHEDGWPYEKGSKSHKEAAKLGHAISDALLRKLAKVYNIPTE